MDVWEFGLNLKESQTHWATNWPSEITGIFLSDNSTAVKIHIHTNKGKHDFYLHFSGYESGELRQEEKQYEETAADRDWNRGKERKRLVLYV